MSEFESYVKEELKKIEKKDDCNTVKITRLENP